MKKKKKNIERKLKYFVLSDHKKFRFLILFGLILGTSIGVVGSLFQLGVIYIGSFQNYILSIMPNMVILKILFSILFSLTLISLSIILVKKFAPEAGGSGVHEVEGALEGIREIHYRRVLPVKFIGGLLSLGAGMSLGREGPTIQIGAAIGKMLSNRWKLGKNFTHILMASGAGAGLATAFNAPLAGIVFVVEEMHKQFKYAFISLQCVVLSCITSTVILHIIISPEPDISMKQFSLPGNNTLFLFIIFGALFGIIGKFFNKGIIKFSDYFADTKPKRYWLLIILLSIVIGTGFVVFPNAVGGGYNVIPQALALKIPFFMLLILFIIRFLAVLICYGTGAPGGVFAPMIALGTIFGLWFGHLVNLLAPHYIISPGVFAVAGMSALFTATVGAPLTGIVLVAEMTMNYTLILPLMITCFSASMVSYLLRGRPLYEILLERTLNREKAQKKSEQDKIVEKKEVNASTN